MSFFGVDDMNGNLDKKLNLLIGEFNRGGLSQSEEKILRDFLDKYAVATYVGNLGVDLTISQWRYKDNVTIETSDVVYFESETRETIQKIVIDRLMNKNGEIKTKEANSAGLFERMKASRASNNIANISQEQKAKAEAEGEKEKNALAYILKAIVNDPSIPYHAKINSVIALGSASCAIIAVQPIPFADIFILTPVQMVMIYYLNRIISDDADADIDAGSLLTTLAAVAGWGLVAQQTILGLYKTVLPFMGGFTTIPLVYGATSAIGYMAVKMLERKAKYKDFDPNNLTPQQRQEFGRVAEQAKRDAKKNKQSLGELKDFVANAKKQAEQFYDYEKEKARLESQIKANKELEQEFIKKQTEYESKLLGLKEDYQSLEDEQLEIMLKNEELSEENKLLLQEFIVIKKQYDDLKIQALENRESKREFYQKRIKLYPNIIFDKNSLDEFLLLNENDNFLVEKLIGHLNNSPDKAHLRCKIESTDFLEYGFGSKGRLYAKKLGMKYHIYRIGNKATQINDIKYLKSLT
ncbi:MAG: hypothetical protein Q3971_07650 [Moraxella sp.]|nr:hypothetical protein [Moraxella sp.]